ncbi:hypothetical protein HU200_016223 [Digitaria exilis]|uniref:Uncharacterized protein n=1 Tax=Digitaria exilis TaxID=1010633 RepID=A0A835F9F9_9POAL|nr:hypothetical protein HU200_016223 [Digitaria exilis]
MCCVSLSLDVRPLLLSRKQSLALLMLANVKLSSPLASPVMCTNPRLEPLGGSYPPGMTPYAHCVHPRNVLTRLQLP